jgi:hypothetical protein
MNRQFQFSEVSSRKRNSQPLTPKQISLARTYARQLNIPLNWLYFSDNMNTSYGNIFGREILYIGSDVAPLPNPPLSGITANSRITIRGCLAHEWIGHRGANLANRAFNRGTIEHPLWRNIALDEAQASIRAARFAPSLGSLERYTLLRDAITRLNDRGLKIRQVKHLLYINQL